MDLRYSKVLAKPAGNGHKRSTRLISKNDSAALSKYEYKLDNKIKLVIAIIKWVSHRFNARNPKDGLLNGEHDQ
jgi:hypothetical protein